MCKRKARLGFTGLVAAILILGATGCNWFPSNAETQQQRDEKTRDEVAKETERLKPTIEHAGKELGKAAEQAAEEAHAAAQGVKEGWQQGSHAPVNVNTASRDDLMQLSGITSREARRIIDGRPYHEKRDLLTKGVLPKASYEKVEDQITVK